MEKNTLLSQYSRESIVRRDDQPLWAKIIARGSMAGKTAASLIETYLSNQCSQRLYLGLGLNKNGDLTATGLVMDIHICRTEYEVALGHNGKLPMLRENLWGLGKAEHFGQNLADILVNPQHQSVMRWRLEVFVKKTESLLKRLCFWGGHSLLGQEDHRAAIMAARPALETPQIQG